MVWIGEAEVCIIRIWEVLRIRRPAEVCFTEGLSQSMVWLEVGRVYRNGLWFIYTGNKYKSLNDQKIFDNDEEKKLKKNYEKIKRRLPVHVCKCWWVIARFGI